LQAAERTAARGSRFHVVTARDEVKALIEALKFPVDARGKQRAAARAEWIAGKPLETHDGIVAG
jgi:hypothetical protein